MKTVLTDFRLEEHYNTITRGSECAYLATNRLHVTVELDVFSSGDDSTKEIEEQLLRWANLLCVEEEEED